MALIGSNHRVSPLLNASLHLVNAFPHSLHTSLHLLNASFNTFHVSFHPLPPSSNPEEFVVYKIIDDDSINNSWKYRSNSSPSSESSRYIAVQTQQRTMLLSNISEIDKSGTNTHTRGKRNGAKDHFDFFISNIAHTASAVITIWITVQQIGCRNGTNM